ncbi:MAG TPA: hypothetical protein PKA90_02795 [Ignavibacteria bacterium]|nr:hypothetical protein [Ignavibacteria bacterium]HMR39336.1 hypothetical protein [Ignavibacteria bacterium]
MDKEEKEESTVAENPVQIAVKPRKKYEWDKLLLEIFAVFLGVTSGFLLSNWQEERQERNLEQKYIAAYIEDVNENITEFEKTIKSDSLWMKQAMPLLISLKDDKFNKDSTVAVMKLIVQISNINSRSVTYEDMKSSGNLNIINDFNLKGMIVDFYSEVNGVKFLEEYFYSYFKDLIMPFVFSEYNVLKEEMINPDQISSVRFTNAFTGYFSMIQQRVAAYNALLIKAYLLRDELNNSLKKN